MNSLRLTASLLTIVGLAGGWAGKALADDDDTRGKLRAVPFVFVGTEAQCGPGNAGSNIVTAGWLNGMGLPDNGTSENTAPNAKRDPHRGLLLNKNGPTTDCSSSGAIIKGFRPGSTISELGFDHRLGDHCGAGAPRFNIVSTAGNRYFVGCAAGTHTAAPQDAQWERVRFTDADVVISGANPGAPAFVFGAGGTPVRSLAIVYDEGTDTSSPSDPAGIGLAVLDNIALNGKLITSGHRIVPQGNRHGNED